MNVRIQSFFKKSEMRKYDFLKNHFIYLKQTKMDNSDIKNQRLSHYKWLVFQIIYLAWSKWANLTNKLNSNNRNFEKNFMLTLKKMFKKLGYFKNNVLDLGGGCGSYRQFWVESAGKIYLNHDPQIGKFEFIKLDHEPIYMVEGYAEKLPYKNNVFDTILIADAIDHFSNPLRALLESIRVLKKRGKIIILQCYRISSGKTLWQKIIYKLKDLINHIVHISHLSSGEIKIILSRVGYQKIRFYRRKIKNNNTNLIIYIAIK